jgi:hypothetical protein
MGRADKPSQVEADLIANRARLVGSLTDLREYASPANLAAMASGLLTSTAKNSVSEAGNRVGAVAKWVTAQISKRF